MDYDDVIDAIGAMFVADKNGDVWVRDTDADNPIVKEVIATEGDAEELLSEYGLGLVFARNVYLIVPTAYVDLVE